MTDHATLKRRAAAQRSNQTPAERRLWSRLRMRNVLGIRFLRQREIEPLSSTSTHLRCSLPSNWTAGSTTNRMHNITTSAAPSGCGPETSRCCATRTWRSRATWTTCCVTSSGWWRSCLPPSERRGTEGDVFWPRCTHIPRRCAPTPFLRKEVSDTAAALRQPEQAARAQEGVRELQTVIFVEWLTGSDSKYHRAVNDTCQIRGSPLEHWEIPGRSVWQ